MRALAGWPDRNREYRLQVSRKHHGERRKKPHHALYDSSPSRHRGAAVPCADADYISCPHPIKINLVQPHAVAIVSILKLVAVVRPKPIFTASLKFESVLRKTLMTKPLPGYGVPMKPPDVIRKMCSW